MISLRQSVKKIAPLLPGLSRGILLDLAAAEQSGRNRKSLMAAIDAALAALPEDVAPAEPDADAVVLVDDALAEPLRSEFDLEHVSVATEAGPVAPTVVVAPAEAACSQALLLPNSSPRVSRPSLCKEY